MKAIILARVSDKKQDSNEAQVNRILEYVSSRNLSVWKTFEIEESSTRGERRKFQEVIKEIKKAKEPIALVVDTVDRLQRSFRESILLDDIRKTGKVEIHFYRESLIIHKNSNSADLLRWDMAVIFARSYVLQLSDNITRKLDQMRLEGKLVGKPPIGYKSVYGQHDQRIGVAIDESTGPIVRLIYKLYSTGNYSLKKIQTELIQRGHLTKNGKRRSTAHIYKILNNPFYIGKMKSKGQTFEHIYLHLIDQALFKQCQSVQKNWKKKPFQHVAKPYIFRGLLRCAKCGCSITPETAKGKYTYYSCTTARKEICSKRIYVPEWKLLDPIYSILGELNKVEESDIELVCALLESNTEDNKVYQAATIKALEKEHEANKEKISRLLDVFLEKAIGRKEYDEKLQLLKERQDEIAAKLYQHKLVEINISEPVKAAIDLAKNALWLFESSEVLQKRQILSFLLQNSSVMDKTPLYNLKSPFQLMLNFSDHSTLRSAVDTLRTFDWERLTKELLELGYLAEVANKKGGTKYVPVRPPPKPPP